jgi:hypothetical protein
MNKAAIALVLAHASTLVLAQSQPASPIAQARSGNANFVCGGIGVGEQEKMKAAAAQHDLMLTFAVSNGAYLADVDVQIKDSKGAVVLAAKCGGPIMLVNLPSGSWHVTAQANGQTREKVVSTSSGRHAQATLVWPAGA